jgi:WD40 repeat protein/energy-coupling factor transporter ATP-binding protein EcfA2
MQRFAADLRALRAEAGAPTYRAMAQRSGYSAPALSQAAAGEKLPTLAVTLAYVAACGGDADVWEKRWQAVAEELAAVPRKDADAEESPYRGLTRFEPGDADVFFGRDQLIESLLDLVRAHRSVVVLGPSGSGKSSLLRAGLIPRLSEGAALDTQLAAIRILTPGAHPMRTHAERLRPAGKPGDTLVLVDQFEEVFTLCTDPAERAEFIDLLLTSQEPAGRLRVVLGVRADFYSRCLEHPALAEVIREAGIPVGPPSREDLREVIVRPATARALTVERALTARLLDEVAGEPGGLPLLSHALLETWRRRSGRMLTLQAYEAAGGVRGAISQTAEDVYGSLSAERADVARLVLLRLVTPGEGAQDTRRPVHRAELDFAPEEEADAVLDRLVSARLLTLDDGTVDLAHEALITAWPRLAGWVDEARESLVVHRRLTDAARTWDDLGREPGALYRGTRLATAREQLTDTELTPLERGFLTASRFALARERRRLKAWVASVSVLLVLALVAGVVAWQQNRTSERRRLEVAATRAATAAGTLRSSDPVLALRLAVAAWRLNPEPETRSALLSALGQNEPAPFVPDRAGTVDGYLLSPDGRTLTTLDGPDGITRWDLHTRRQISSHRAPPGGASIASPDGRYVIVDQSESEKEGMRLWDVEAERFRGNWVHTSVVWEPIEMPQGEDDADTGPDLNNADADELGFGVGTSTATVSVPAFSSSGHAWMLQRKGELQVWDTRGRRLFRGPLPDGETAAYDITPDNRTLAVCTARGLALWDLRAQRRMKADWTQQPNCGPNDALEFSTDGRVLAVWDANHLRRWSIATGKQLPAISGALLDHHALSPDGQFIAGVGGGAITLWRADRPDAPVFRHPLTDHEPHELRFDLRAAVLRYVVRGTRDTGTVRSVDISRVIRPSWRTDTAGNALLSADGSTLAVQRKRGSQEGHLALYDTRTGRLRSEIAGVPMPAQDHPWTGGLSLSADGRRLAFDQGLTSILADRTRITVWDTVARRRLSTVELSSERPWSFALSPDGRELTTSDGLEPDLTVWDAGTGRRLRRVGGAAQSQESGEFGAVSAISPDGRTLLHDDGTLLPTSGRPGAKTALDANLLAAFSPDGDTVALVDPNDRITLWDPKRRSSLGILAGGISLTGPAAGEEESTTAMAFSPDGTVLVAAGSQGTLRMWDVPSRRPLGAGLTTAGDDITSLAFSPDGDTLFAAGRHVPLQRYTVDPDRLAEAACHRAGGALTRQQWRAYLPDVPYRSVCGKE